jgi:hypothetical protein
MSSVNDGLILNGGEEIRAVLGKENNYTNGQKPVIILTNQRIHFCEEHYRYDNGDTSRKIYETESLPLQDFIGAGYIRKKSRRNLYYLVSAGILIMLLSWISKGASKWGLKFDIISHFNVFMFAVFVGLLVTYLFKRYRLFEIAFVGKRLCVDEHHFSKSELQEFIQAVYQTKRE